MTMRRVFLLLFSSALFIDCTGDEVSEDGVSVLITNLTTGYNKQVRPNFGKIPVTVGVSLYILSLGELSEKTMDFTFDMYFRQFWHDPRLTFELLGLENLVLRTEFFNKIWVPDTFFVNEKDSNYHDVTDNNQALLLHHTGDITRSTKFTMKAICPMDLQYFPMDSHLCTLEIESFAHTMADIRYAWKNGDHSVHMSPDVSLPEFHVLGHRQRIVEASLSSGNYSRLLADVQFSRAVGSYLIQVYLPIALMVMMSWLAFWLSEVSARVELCMVSILTVISIAISIHSSLARISYFTAMDIYFSVSFLFIFATLMESVFLSFATIWMQKVMEEENPEDLKIRCMKNLYEFTTRYTDLLGRIGFPVTFLIFNIVYWNFYSTVSKKVLVDDLIYLQ